MRRSRLVGGIIAPVQAPDVESPALPPHVPLVVRAVAAWSVRARSVARSQGSGAAAEERGRPLRPPQTSSSKPRRPSRSGRGPRPSQEEQQGWWPAPPESSPRPSLQHGVVAPSSGEPREPLPREVASPDQGRLLAQTLGVRQKFGGAVAGGAQTATHL